MELRIDIAPRISVASKINEKFPEAKSAVTRDLRAFPLTRHNYLRVRISSKSHKVVYINIS